MTINKDVIISYIRWSYNNHKPTDVETIAKDFGYTKEQMRRTLRNLLRQERISKVKVGRYNYYGPAEVSE